MGQKKFMKAMLMMGILPLAVCFNQVCYAVERMQQTVQGTVRDAQTSSLLTGVSVSVKGTGHSVTTDADGKFSITVPDRAAVLVFTNVGYISKEVAAEGGRLDILLVPSETELDEVIVVGYGTQRKADLTGAVSIVGAKEITQRPVDRVEQGLQGRIPGVQVTSTTGAPAGGMRIRIRGSNSIQYGNSPLYVIDGFPMGGSSEFMNPNDVESITVLKDASATAIYGARGANGVVLITTKKGIQGATQITYDAYYGSQSVTKKLDLLNAKDYATLARTFWSRFRNGSLVSRAYSEEEIAQMGNGTDWQDAIFQTAPMHSHNVSVRGGNEKTRFALSGNYFDQDGIVIFSKFQKGNVALNLDHSVSEKLKIGANVSVGYNKDRPIQHSTSGHGNSGVIYAALQSDPVQPVKYEDGTYSSQDRLWTTTGLYANPAIQNPVEMAEKAEALNTRMRLLGNFYARYELAEGLVAKTTFGTYLTNGRNRSYLPSYFVNSRTTGGSGSVSSSELFNWVNENTLTYKKSINDRHNLEVLGGFTMQRESEESLSATSYDYFTDVLGFYNLGLGEDPQYPSTGYSRWSMVSFLGRVNYDFESRYLLTVSARYDGSSRFGKNNRFGFFPSAAVAWNIKNEEFLKPITWLSELKLRSSIGVTGNQSIPLYRNLQTYGLGSPYSFGGQFVTSIVPEALVNEDMKWESTRQIDVGLDIGFWNNRLSLVADYYHKKTSDLLFSVEIPRQGGFTSMLQNIGSVQNKGVELGIAGVISEGDFRWDASANISFNRNKVLQLADADRFFGSSISSYLIQRNGGAGTVVMVDQPIGMFWGNIFDGLWQTQAEFDAGHMAGNGNSGPGFENYRDIDGNGTFEEGLDETIIGNPHPDYVFGFNTNLAYKGFDLGIFLNGVQGNDVLNLNLIDLTTQVNGMNGLAIYKEAWDGPGTSNRIAKIDRPDGRQGTFPNRVSTNYLEDGSFVRLSNVTLGYTLPLANSKLRTARVYVAGENLYTWTNYTGYDPEVNSLGDNNTVFGVDMNAYPRARMFRVGIQVGF